MRVLISIAFLTWIAAPAFALDPLVVHEWGTFTSLLDESGHSIGGINVEDEPLPAFVHQLDEMLMIHADAPPPVLFQGAPAAHPDATMRLETPVIYFHPPKNATFNPFDLKVSFKGGWLTQFYPNADAKTDGPGDKQGYRTRPISVETVGSLSWQRIQLGMGLPFPETKENVWLAPRKVDAANISMHSGENERFLFYRGVGHIEAPLMFGLTEGSHSALFVQDLNELRPRGPFWLLNVRDDGSAAFRRFDRIPRTPPAAPVGRDFSDSDFSKDNIGKLRQEMHVELVHAGLFDDEAEALLNTWQLSYFKSVGTRVFYLVPRDWTDRVLPMTLSIPAEVTRVMVARTELMTGRERDLLKRIAQGPASDAQWLRASLDPKHTSSEPEDYRAYRQLGRLRDAMLLDELKRRPTPALKQFVDNYGLNPSRVDTSKTQ